MAQASTLYRFRIDVSDIDRGFYDSLDLRVAMHPSETSAFLLTRVIAFALNSEDGLAFSPGGLSDTEEPALQIKHPDGTIPLWIEVGSPTARRLHKASKASRKVKVYTYKDIDHLIREMRGAEIHRRSEIDVFALEERFLRALAEKLSRDNRWTLVRNDGSLLVTVDDEAIECELHRAYC